MALGLILLPIMALALLSIFAGYIAVVLLLLRQGKVILGLILPFAFLIFGGLIFLIPVIVFGYYLTRLLLIVGVVAIIFAVAGFVAAFIGKLLNDNRNF